MTSPSSQYATISRAIGLIFDAEPANSKIAGGVAFMIIRSVFLILAVRHSPQAVAEAMRGAVDKIEGEMTGPGA